MSSRDDNVKILVIGPQQVGKSNLANVLGGLRDSPTESYKETCPLRILETAVEGLNTTGAGRKIGKGARADVELWDVGGNVRFRNCWPAIKQDADGIIFVMNIEVQGQERELDFWAKEFLDTKKVPVNHCIVFAHHSTPPREEGASGNSPQRLPPLPRTLQTCRGMLETSLDGKSDNFKEAFERLIEQVLVTKNRKAEEEAYQNEMQKKI